MLLVSGQALGERVRAADLLQARRDLGVVQVGVVATLTADELERAAFHPAIHYQDRLAAQYRSAAMTSSASLRGGTETWTSGSQPRITGVMRAARCGGGIRTVRWRRAVGGTERFARHGPPEPVGRIPPGSGAAPLPET